MTEHTATEGPEFVALIGIDWADRKHDVALRAVGTDRVELDQIDHTPEALDAWATALRERFAGPVAVVVELTRGPLINALQKYEFITIFPLPPARLASYRGSVTSSGAKDDPTDAQLALDYLEKHGDNLRAWVPEEPRTRELSMLCESRRKFVALRTRLSNRLTSSLKLYFPQALEWLDDLTTPLACDFLLRWPTLEALQQAKPQTIRKFFYAHSRGRSTRT